MRDRSTQTVLATFIGAFVYALSSIILRSARFFDDRDIVVLFAMTLAVIVLVVVMMMRWLVRLQTMGSLTDTADRIEELTAEAFRQRMKYPCLGAQALGAEIVIPDTACDVRAPCSGYVERVFPAAIDAHAKACGGQAYLVIAVGDYVSQEGILAHVTDPALESAVLANVEIGPMRDVEQQVRRTFLNVLARNQDDHVKNIAFLMNRQGAWRLSPAFDIAYSYNPSGNWTSRHQMSVNGKRDGFEVDDLVSFAKVGGLKAAKARTILQEVSGAVSQWQTFADQAGLTDTDTVRIERAHRQTLFV